MGVDVTVGDAAVDLGGGGGMIEAVLAGAQAAMGNESEEIEGDAGAKNAVLLEKGGYLEGRGSGGDVDEALGGGAEGGEHEPGGKGEEQNGDEEGEPNDGKRAAGRWARDETSAGACGGTHLCIVGGVGRDDRATGLAG